MAVSTRVKAIVVVSALVAAVGMTGAAGAAASRPSSAEATARYWTAERMAAAIPRDLVVDERGRGYLRLPDGTLQRYGGRAVPAAADDTSVTDLDPAANATIGATHQFKATVTDPDGIKSVSFAIGRVGSSSQSFNASHIGGNVWAVTIQGFTDGDWQWSVTVRDRVKQRGGNTTVTPMSPFFVRTGSSGGGSDPDPGTGETVTNAQWTAGGDVQTAVGRIYFEMPANKAGTRWSGYVCSGTTANDGGTDRSIIITAAHCVYDDANKVFARNVMFIPNQAGSSAKTDTNCDNDPFGCWKPSHGVVDVNWANRTWPNNIPWDYAYYVVPDGAHVGTPSRGGLDATVPALTVQFDAPGLGAYTHAMGYSYSEDPKFMYCAEGLATESSYNDWWLGSCGLSGGSSGGPWIQPLTNGTGPIISVNSWGYSNQPGMGGPRLHDTSAECVFGYAKDNVTNDTRGYKATC